MKAEHDTNRDASLEGPNAAWVNRLLAAARAGAPSLRTLLTAGVVLKVSFGSSREAAEGATIVSEWLAGRFAVAPHFEVVSQSGKGSRVTAQIKFGGDPAYPAAWHIEVTLTPDGLATEIALRTPGSA